MKLLSLSLREFRSFETCDLEFPDGLIGVRGPNGAGKSTLAEAIAWALFGKLRPGSKIGDARRQGAQGPSSVDMTFRIGPTIYRVKRVVSGPANLWIGDAEQPESTQTGATNLAIARELGIGWESFQRTVFARQKDVAALDPSATKGARTAHVERLLGLKRYREAATASKTRAKTLADQLAGMREEAPDLIGLRELLQLALEAAASGSPAVIEAEQLVQNARTRHSDAQTAVADELERVSTAGRLSDQLTTLRAGLRETLDDLAGRQARAEGRRTQQERLATLLTDAPDLVSARDLRTRWEALQTCKAELDQLPPAAASRFDAEGAAQADARLASVREEYEAVSSVPAPELDSLSRRTQALEACAGLPPQHEAVASEQLVAAEREAARVKRGTLRDRIDTDLAHLAALEENGAEEPCPICLRPYGEEFVSIQSEHERRIAVARTELEALEQMCAELDEKHAAAGDLADRTKAAGAALAQTAGPDTLGEAQTAHATATSMIAARGRTLEALRSERDELERRVAEDTKRERTVANERAARSAAETRFATAAAALGGAAFDPDALAAAVAAMAKAEEIDNERRQLQAALAANEHLAGEITELEQRRDTRAGEIDQLAAQLAELAVVPGHLDSLKQAREDTNDALAKAVETMQDAKLRAQGSDQTVGELRARLGEAEEIHAKIAEREREHREQSAATALLTDFRAAQSARAWPNLEQGASVLLSDTTDGRYADVRMSEDYRLEVVDRGERFGLERYSGGEQDLANLCLRLAIADWVARENDTELGLVVLDEVFGSQDEDRRQRLLEALRSLGNRFNQLLVITHMPEIADLCDHQLVVTLAEPGRSVAELVPA
jgi:exonuclease SbcC